MDDKIWTKIKKMVLDGESCNKVALRFGVSPSTVYVRAKKEGWRSEAEGSVTQDKTNSKVSGDRCMDKVRGGNVSKSRKCKSNEKNIKDSSVSKQDNTKTKSIDVELLKSINGENNNLYETDAVAACQIAVDRALLKAALGLMEAETNISKAMEPVDKALRIKRELAKESKEHGTTTIVVETLVPEPSEEALED